MSSVLSALHPHLWLDHLVRTLKSSDESTALTQLVHIQPADYHPLYATVLLSAITSIGDLSVRGICLSSQCCPQRARGVTPAATKPVCCTRLSVGSTTKPRLCLQNLPIPLPNNTSATSDRLPMPTVIAHASFSDSFRYSPFQLQSGG